MRGRGWLRGRRVPPVDRAGFGRELRSGLSEPGPEVVTFDMFT